MKRPTHRRPDQGGPVAERRQSCDTLDRRDLTLVGFSTGGGEVARYVGRHGTDRVAQVALVSAVPLFMLQRSDNRNGVPIEVFDEIRNGSLADRSQLYRDLADGPFFGHNQPASRRGSTTTATSRKGGIMHINSSNGRITAVTIAVFLCSTQMFQV